MEDDVEEGTVHAHLAIAFPLAREHAWGLKQ